MNYDIKQSKEKSGMKSGRWMIASGLLVLVALLVVGCGGSGSSSSSESSFSSNSSTGSSEGSASESSTGEDAGAQAAAKWFKGTYTLPTVKPFKVPKDKNVWLISFGTTIGASQRVLGGFTEAAELFGWKIHTYDGKFEPNEYLAGIRSAIAAHADAIFTYVIDCSDVAPGLKEAEAAGIPTINNQGQDCNEAKEGGEHLFTYDLTYGGKNLLEFFEEYGELSAAWVAAEEPEAKILNFEETDSAVTITDTRGFVNGIKALCPGCEIEETIPFLGGEIGPELQSKAEQALLKHPSATTVAGPYEDPIVNAVIPAIQNSGRSGQVSAMPGESSVAATELMQEGKLQVIVGQDNTWEGFMSFDAVARILANRNPDENEASGMGLQLVDASNNTPEAGQIWKIKGFDYKGAFESAWLK